MVVTVTKTFFEKLQPKVVNDKFRTDLLSKFGKANIEENENGLNNLLNACKRILDIHVTSKQKYARGNRMLFTNKALSKEIMARLRNKFLKDRNEENKKKFSKQRNFCVSLLRKSKSYYFGNLNKININDSKTFWETINPFLSGDYNTSKVLDTFFSVTLISQNIRTVNLLLTISAILF